MTARVRNILTYAQFGGEVCEGEAAEMNVCNDQDCPSKLVKFSNKNIFTSLINTNFDEKLSILILFSCRRL